jgi:hypothetical protein
MRQEVSPEHDARAEVWQRVLRETTTRPAPDAGLFTTVAKNRHGHVTMHLPGGGRALAAFSSPLRAVDYVDVFLDSDPSWQFVVHDAPQFLDLLRAMQAQVSIIDFALDRCPRCSTFNVACFTPQLTADNLFTLWTIARSASLARFDLYFEHAIDAMRRGDALTGKEIGLELVGHVMPENPAAHFLLGTVAVQLEDRVLLGEAERFLRYMNQEALAQNLARLAETRSLSAAGMLADELQTAVSSGLPPDATTRRGSLSPTHTALPRETAPPGDDQFAVGNLVEGVFRVKEVRRGGMGVVHIVEAEDVRSADPYQRFLRSFAGGPAGDAAGRLQNRRWFAIKVLRTGQPSSFLDTQRFERECLIWATFLPHPNVTRAFTAGRIGELTPFVLLEFVDGGSLRDRIRGGMTPAAAMHVALQVCRGMVFLNRSAGIVHRDIKPANILLTHDGVAKVTDFGLAQILPVTLEASAGVDDRVADVALARDALLAGSLPYMSPEQFLGLPADVRSDVYSFGIVLYEMFSRRRPFAASGFAAHRDAHLYSLPAPLQTSDGLPAGLDGIVMACLAKQPADRVQDFAELGSRLADVCHRAGLGDLVPEDIPDDALRAGMGAADWHGRAEALLMIGEGLHNRHQVDDAGPYLERAHASFRRACQADGDELTRLAGMGRALHLLARDEEAVRHLSAHLSSNPETVRPYLDLSTSLNRLGDVTGAREALNSAAARWPEDSQIRIARFTLDRQHGTDQPASATAAAGATDASRSRRPSFWARLIERARIWIRPASLVHIRFSLPGWSEESYERDIRVWRDRDGSVLVLGSEPTRNDWPRSDGLTNWGREWTQQSGGGLVEVRSVSGPNEPGIRLVYKKFESGAYMVTGMLFLRHGATTQIWTIVAGELPSRIGVREATISSELLNSGTLTREQFDRVWFAEPAGSGPGSADPSVRRFISDDESYDTRFPEHPLSKVRRVLAAIPEKLVEAERP